VGELPASLAIAPDDNLRLAFAAAVTAIVSVQVIMLVVRAILAPHAPNTRLMPISDNAARTISGYLHKVLSLAVYGNTIILMLSLYGMPALLASTMRNVVALLVLVLIIFGILRDRHIVAEAIARLAGSSPTGHWTQIPWRYIARIWHIIAIFFTLSLFGIYTLEGEELFLRVFGIAALSLLVMTALVVFLRYAETHQSQLRGDVEETDEDDEESDQAAPDGQANLQPRASLMLIFLRFTIFAVAALTFLEVWGISTWGWLFSGESSLSRGLQRIAITIAVIYLIWLGVSNMIAGYIRRLQERAGAERSTNRTQTVLVLARNALFFALCVVGVLSILPQLGINVGPLLAGAGVLGVAIGFGSQRLVQDIISGLFNLIEDNFAVGDVVDLSGKSGVVEAVTIRTVRLRDLAGNVHTIPFSAIDVVTNMTKDFSCAVFEIGVAYREDVDQVMKAIEEVGQSMRRERSYRRVILEPLEMFGLDSLGDSSVNVKCRIKVRPGSQWMITREFNRRLKKRFDELGIEIPFPHQTVYFGTGRDGAAPAAHIMLERGEAASNVPGDKIATAAS
ncbi:MAG: mechanosensitive ion channel family protein, partial [Pseudomonadota bacterium]